MCADDGSPTCHPCCVAAAPQAAGSPTVLVAPPATPSAGAPPGSAVPVLPASAWELGSVVPLSSHAAAAAGSGAGAEADGSECDVPPLDLGMLCGQAVSPANLGALQQNDGGQRR